MGTPRPILVGKYESRTLGSIPMYLDRDNNAFYASVGGEVLYDARYNELALQVKQQADRADGIKWQPVIRVWISEPRLRSHTDVDLPGVMALLPDVLPTILSTYPGVEIRD